MSTIDTNITLRDLYTESIKKYADNRSYSIINGESLTYGQFGERVEKLKSVLRANGVKKGYKVAILGASMPNWPVSYFAITTMGAVAVPLLPDFTAFEIANILDHSSTTAIIVSKRLIYKLSDTIKDKMDIICSMDNLELLKVPSDNILYPSSTDKENTQENKEFEEYAPLPDDLASIIYTSGTSGTSKGVMLTHTNLCSNLQMCYDLYPINENDIFLSFLPLSHAYECTLGMMYPLTKGASVYYLDGAPTPSLLMPALQKVRPTIICSVPLIVEKIFKNKIRPMFTKNWAMQFLYSINIVRRLLHKLAGKKLLKLFGGRLRFFGVGGSKLDGAVEQFLRDANFPYAIGYGLTECSPLIAGMVDRRAFQSTGPKLDGVEMIIHNPNELGIGEIWVKGPNIMKGYYKDPAKTEAAFSSDGWFRTKDLGIFDKKGYLYIKGRVDNMIIGANGENIYPEEIEAIINDNDFVLESLVTQKGNSLVAKVYFNYDQIAKLIDFRELEASIKKNISAKYQKLNEKYDQLYEKYEKWRADRAKEKDSVINNKANIELDNPDKKGKKGKKERNVREEVVVTFQDKLNKVQKELLAYVNERVNKSSRIAEIIEQSVPFEKTATKKIKRYLYA